MTPVSLCVMAFTVSAVSSGAVEVADAQALIFDDECDAHSPCALELLQRSHQKFSKPPHASLVSHIDSLAVEADATSALVARSKRQAELFSLLDGRDYPELDEGIWTFDIPRMVKITTWTGQFYMGEGMVSKIAPNCHYEQLSHGDEDITFFPPSIPGHKACCEWEYVIHDNTRDISSYDVVLFYLPYMMRTDWRKSLPVKKKEGQLWIATCGEPMFREETFMDCRLANNTDFMQHMDGFSSYSGTSDFPSFFDTPSEQQMRLDPPNFADRGEELVTMSLSDCYNEERNAFLKAFLGQFEAENRSDAILSYGECFHNAKEPDKGSCGEPTYDDPWTNRCSSRPFKIVAENSFDSWYITEKIWGAFFEGAIPIYYGPTEAKRLVPPDSVVFAEDYEGPAALARAILAFTDKDIEKAHAWKKLPRSEWNEWPEARRNGHVTLLPRICEAATRAQETLNPSLIRTGI